MADFRKPLSTQSSDSIITDFNEKIEALAKMSLITGWDNVPAGTVAFDNQSSTFKRKSTSGDWEIIQLSISLGNSAEIDSLTATTFISTTSTISNLTVSGTLSGPDVQSIRTRLNAVEAASYSFGVGVVGEDFNVDVEVGANDVGQGNAGTIRFHLPDASFPATRGAVSKEDQSFAGKKIFVDGISIPRNVNNVSFDTETHIKTSDDDGIFRIYQGDTVALSIRDNRVGLNTIPHSSLTEVQVGGGLAIRSLNELSSIKVTHGNDGTSSITTDTIRLAPNTTSNVVGITSEKAVGVTVPVFHVPSKTIFGSASSSALESPTQHEALNLIGGKILVSNSQETLPYFSSNEKSLANILGYQQHADLLLSTGTKTTKLGVDATNNLFALHSNTDLVIKTSSTSTTKFSLDEGTERVRITNSGRVGIGTNSPTDLLHVAGALRISSSSADSTWDPSTLRIFTQAGGDGTITSKYESFSHQFNVGASRSTGVLINSSGQVAIGTTSPAGSIKLDVRGRIALGSGSADAELVFRRKASTTTAWMLSTRGDVGGDNDDFKLLRFNSSGSYLDIPIQVSNANKSIGLYTTPYGWHQTDSRVSIDTDGNFGIMVHNGGTTYLTTNAYYNTSRQWVRKSYAGSALYSIGDSGHYWHSASINLAETTIAYTLLMGLSSSGNLSVTGNVSTSGNLSVSGYVTSNLGIGRTAEYALDVDRYSSSGVARIRNTYSGGRSELVFANDTYPDGNGGIVLLGSGSGPTHSNNLNIHTTHSSAISTWTNGIWRNSTDQNGHFIPGADNTYTLGWPYNRWNQLFVVNANSALSDERTKFDIKDSSLGLDFINRLRPVTYKKKEAQKTEEKTGEFTENGIAKTTTTVRIGIRNHCGFLAQQVRESLPDDSFSIWQLADKNNPNSEQALVYEELIAPMVKAIQQLSKKVNDLEAELAELKNNKV
jgi:hypothetical protein